jgi:hypothetical protein
MNVGIWARGFAIPRKGMHKWDFRCSGPLGLTVAPCAWSSCFFFFFLHFFVNRRGHLPDARGVEQASEPEGAELPGATVAPRRVHVVFTRQNFNQAGVGTPPPPPYALIKGSVK